MKLGLWISGMPGGGRMKHTLRRTPCLQWSMAEAQWCSGETLLRLALESCSVWRARWIQLGIRKSWEKMSCPLWGSWSLGFIGPSNRTMIPCIPQNPPGLFQKKSRKILEWPSQSPDVNPVENLWCDFKKAACKPKNICAHEGWANIPQERYQKLVSGYASRLQQVVTAKGCFTRYWRCLSWRGWIILTLQCLLKVTFCVEFGETTCNISCTELFKLF